MFALTVPEIPDQMINSTFFQFDASLLGISSGIFIFEQIEMQLCNRSDWQGIDEQLLDYYNIENEWLCPKNGPVRILNTPKDDDNYQYLAIFVDYCLEDDYCENTTEIENYISKIAKEKGYLTAELLILDKTFQPKEQNSTKPSIKEYNTAFTHKTGAINRIFMAEYEV